MMEERAGNRSSGATAAKQAAGAGTLADEGRRLRPGRLLWLMLALAGLAAAVWPQDQKYSERAVEARPRIEQMLGGPAAAGVVLIPVAILLSFPNRRRLVVGFITPMALSALMTQVVKWVVGRARPDGGLGPMYFDVCKSLPGREDLGGMGEFQSFPSGDATTAIALALLLGLYFPRGRWIFYMYAAFVGLGRIVLARHFPSDVLAGYAVGAAGVYICVRLLGPSFYERDWVRRLG